MPAAASNAAAGPWAAQRVTLHLEIHAGFGARNCTDFIRAHCAECIPVGLADRTMVTCVGIQTLTAGKAWLSMDSRADLMGALKVEPAQRDPAISEVVRWPPRS